MEKNPAEKLKPRRNLWKWALLIVGAIVIIIGIWFGLLIYTGFKDKDLVEKKLVEYMQDLVDGKLDVVYNDLSSVRMKDVMSFDEFKEATGVMPCTFIGFQNLDFSGFNIQQTNEGTFYRFAGDVTYTNGDKGSLAATLEKNDGEYKITGVHIDVSPERFKALCTQNKSSTSTSKQGNEAVNIVIRSY